LACGRTIVISTFTFTWLSPLCVVSLLTHLIRTPSPPSVMVHSCNPSTEEAEARRSRVLGQPGLHK
jgi:hypothetical protein